MRLPPAPSRCSAISMGYASDAIAAARTSEYPLALRMQQAFKETQAQPLQHLERITASAIRTYNREQLELSIDIFIRGTDTLLYDINKARKSP
jgi:hypothetical protein